MNTELRDEAWQTLQLITDWSTVTTIAQARGVYTNTINALLVKLIAKGYVERKKEGRFYYYHRLEMAKPEVPGRTCDKCGVTKPETLGNFQHKNSGRFRPTCNACRNVARREQRAEAAKPVVKDPTANAFNWRVFVQPFQPQPDKWSAQ